MMNESMSQRRSARRHVIAGRLVGALSLAVLCPSAPAGDGCRPDWDHTPFEAEELNGPVRAMIVFDAGSGPRLYVGGDFTVAGGIDAHRIAAWDGRQWHAVGEGFNGRVRALSIFDDGSGPSLHAAGEFTMSGEAPIAHVARWDGVDWQPLAKGVNDAALAMAVFDDGTGDALYVGGAFDQAGGQPASRVARWDGAAWSALQSGVTGGIAPTVESLAVFDDGRGDGAALYLTGNFSAAGGAPAARIARWDGNAFSALSGGLSGIGRALATLTDGSGTNLYVSGSFTSVGNGIPANFIARWDGSAWSALGDGLSWHGRAMRTFDDGAGAALYVGGQFLSAGGIVVSYVARWDGAAWSPLGFGANDPVWSLCTFDDGGGEALYVGGLFTIIGGAHSGRIACWRGCAAKAPPDPADLNGDDAVNVFDLLILLANWGECGAEGPCPADMNADQEVNVFDLLVLLAAWG